MRHEKDGILDTKVMNVIVNLKGEEVGPMEVVRLLAREAIHPAPEVGVRAVFVVSSADDADSLGAGFIESASLIRPVSYMCLWSTTIHAGPGFVTGTITKEYLEPLDDESYDVVLVDGGSTHLARIAFHIARIYSRCKVKSLTVVTESLSTDGWEALCKEIPSDWLARVRYVTGEVIESREPSLTLSGRAPAAVDVKVPKLVAERRRLVYKFEPAP